MKRIHPESRDAKKPYRDVDSADPGCQSDGVHRYPLDTVEHIKAPGSTFTNRNDAAKYTAGQVSKIKAKIVSSWKAKIDGDGPPSAESKSADDAEAARAAAEPDRELTLAARNSVRSLKPESREHFNERRVARFAGSGPGYVELAQDDGRLQRQASRRSRSRRLASPRDKARLRDLAGARQLSEETEPREERFQEVGAEPERPQGIIHELHLNHVEI